MAFLTELWMPILVSAVFVFIVSSITHMVLPYHKSDFKKMDGEDAVMEAMRTNGVKPGCYMFPCGESMKDWDSPEMKAKRDKGPLGILTVVGPDGFNMGKSLGLWFAYTVLIGILVAYVGWHSLGAGAHYRTVFRVVGTAALLGYAIGYLHNSIWKGESWTTTAKMMFDGLLYTLVTAGTFGWLWPE